jgi:autotransporter-associated beta strand protein
VAFTGSGATFTNSGTVTGGNGGVGGSAFDPAKVGANGNGGVGIFGANLTIINFGTITGGLSGDGSTRANAITFTGGTNTLTLQAGTTITGNVVAFSAADSLILGGSTAATLDTSTIGAGAQYQNFGVFQKTGTSTWLLTGGTTATTPWTVSGGTLAVAVATGLGVGTTTVQSGASLAISAAIGNNLSLTGDGVGGAGALIGTGVGVAVVNGTVTLTGNTSIGVTTAGDTLGISGVIGDGGNGFSLTKVGAGQLLLTQVNTYTGATVVNDGSLALTGTGSIAASSGVTLNAANTSLDISDTTAGATIAGLSSTQVTSKVYLGNQTLTVNLTAGTDGFSGVIKDAGGIGGGTGGSLIKTGAGTLLLTQVQAYTGSTTISGGTLGLTGTGSIASSSGLSIGAAGTLDISFETAGATVSGLTGAAGSTVNLGNQTLTVNLGAGTNTFAGSLKNGGLNGGTGGALLKSGGGTLVLSGANSYTGATTITNGTLAIGAGGSIATSSGVALSDTAGFDISGGGNQTVTSLSGAAGNTVKLGANALTVSGNVSSTFAGVISDGGISGGTGGSLVKTGFGVLTLSGANTYTGGTTIGSGEISVGNAAALGTGAVTVQSGGILNLPGVTIANAVSLSGNGIDAGGAVIASGNAGISGNMTLASNTSVNVTGASGSLTLGGVISGGFGLTKLGAGVLVLTGTDTYSGATTVTAGTLQIGAGGSTGSIASSGISLAGGTTLAFNRSGTLTYGGTLSGTGSLVQQGSGTTILNGASGGFAGATTITAGTLEIGDSTHSSAALGGNVTVGANGTLMGHGTIGGNVSNAGNVRPGGSVGITTVSGNYTQSSSGTLTIEITPDAASGPGVGYSQLRVTGTATLAGGALSIVDDPGTYAVGSRYTVLTAAGGLTGTFATVAYNPAFAAYITPSIAYTGTGVKLELDPTPGATPAATAPLFTGGQQIPDMLTAMVAAAQGVSDTVLGDVCGPTAQRLITQGQGCVVRALDSGYQTEVWMRGLGGIGSLTGGGGRLSFSDSYGGALLGAGVSQGGFTVGAGAGYLATMLSFGDGSGASQNAGLGFVYARYAQGPWWVGAMGAYGGGQVNGNRAVPGTGLTATGKRDGDFGVMQLRAAYDLPVGPYTVEPRAGFIYVHAGQGSFAESGAGLLDLNYASSHADVSAGRASVRVMRRASFGGWALVPWAEIGLEETFSGLSRHVLVSAGPFGADVGGVSPAPTAALLGVGVSAAASDKLDLFIAYQGRLSANQTQNAFSAGMQLRF